MFPFSYVLQESKLHALRQVMQESSFTYMIGKELASQLTFQDKKFFYILAK